MTNNTGAERFQETYFEAALDASKGRSWPPASLLGNTLPRYQTQIRHVERSTLLLGLSPETDNKVREQIAHLLDVPGQCLHDGTRQILNQSTYQVKGAAVCDILSQITSAASLFERITEAGFIVGLWPECWVWDLNLGKLLRTSFRITGTRASPD